MKGRRRLSELWSAVLVVLATTMLGTALLFAADYKQCVTVDVVGKPSNKYSNGQDNVYVDSKMYYFSTGDSFKISVTNTGKCPVKNKLYVTVNVPKDANTYYHYLDVNSTAFGKTINLATQKKELLKDSQKGTVDLWSFPIDQNLKFQGPIFFRAYLTADNGTAYGFDSKMVYINDNMTLP